MARKAKDSDEYPEFATLKEELAWLKAKKTKTDFDKMRIAFLEAPVQAIGPSKTTAKKVKVKAEPKKAPVKKSSRPIAEGDFYPTPTNLSMLKSYITNYCKALGWKSKSYKFPDTNSLTISGLKITADKEANTVTITGKLTWQNSKQLYSKGFKHSFTIERYNDIKTLMVNTYRKVRDVFKDKETVETKYFRDNGWGLVYDRLMT